MKPQILIADTIHDNIFPMLENAGFDVMYRPDIDRQSLIEALAGVDGLIIRSKTAVDADLIRKAKKLRFVGRAGAGLDTFDLKALSDKHIEVLNSPEGNRDAVAEHAIGMILSLLNNFKNSMQQLKEHSWEREANRGYELSSLTIGIIGYGNVGSALAGKLAGFGCRVIAFDKYRSGFSDANAIEVSMDQLFNETDILSVNTPLTAETDGMINSDFIRRFHKNIYLINTARGKIIRWEDLPGLLETGKLRGLGLDVLPNENPAKFAPGEKEIYDVLVNHPNTVMTPHVAGWTYESLVKINQALVDKIKRLIYSDNPNQ